jgi:hypothetical protein
MLCAGPRVIFLGWYTMVLQAQENVFASAQVQGHLLRRHASWFSSSSWSPDVSSHVEFVGMPLLSPWAPAWKVLMSFALTFGVTTQASRHLCTEQM